MNTQEKIKLRKLDCALSQLDTAIALWFNEGDFASILTLTCAAHEMIAGMVHHRKLGETLFTSLIFKDEHRKEVNKLFRKPQNFLKHSDRDPDPEGSIEIVRDQPRLLMMLCLWGLELMKVELSGPQEALYFWNMLHYPEDLTEKGKQQAAQMKEKLGSNISNLTPREYFQLHQKAYPHIKLYRRKNRRT